MRFVLILALLNNCYLADGGDIIEYRLVNGKRPTQGRLEITYNGVRGSVCGGDTFKEAEARVVCKSLGYRGGTAQPGAALYGQGKGTIWLSKVQCKGNEAELSDCKHEKWGDVEPCTHMDDVGIECIAKLTHGMYRLSDESFGIGAGVVEVFYKGQWGTICYNVNTEFSEENAKVVCKSIGYTGHTPAGYGEPTQAFVWKDVTCKGDEDYLHECEFKETNRCNGYRAPQVLCDVPFRYTQSEGKWKFVDGPSPVNGRVEAWDDGIWGSVCNSSFDDVDASILCRSFNFRSGKMSVKNYPGQGLIKYTDIQCGGAEPSLQQCSKSTNTSSCTHAQDVAVTCDVKNEHVKLRLRKGPSKYSGRLEVSLLGEWGTVSGKHFRTPEAEVACRTLGHKGGRALHAILGNPAYGRGKGRVWMHGVNCTGKEKHLNECKFPGWGIEEPSHGRDVSIQCLPFGPITEEYTLSYKLVDGPNKFEGRLEVRNSIMLFYGWGTVCNNLFDEKTARVICRSQKFDGGKVIAKVKPGKGPILLDNIVCNGTETTLKDCTLNWGESHCTHDQDVYIKCTDPAEEKKPLTEAQKFTRKQLQWSINFRDLDYLKLFKQRYEDLHPPADDEVLQKAIELIKILEPPKGCVDHKDITELSCADRYYSYGITYGKDPGVLCFRKNNNRIFKKQCCKTCEDLKKGIKPIKPKMNEE